MTFEEILDQAMAMLQRRGRVTYRTLQAAVSAWTTTLLRPSRTNSSTRNRSPGMRTDASWCGRVALIHRHHLRHALPHTPPSLLPGGFPASDGVSTCNPFHP